jgi:hypothetical protein
MSDEKKYGRDWFANELEIMLTNGASTEQRAKFRHELSLHQGAARQRLTDYLRRRLRHLQEQSLAAADQRRSGDELLVELLEAPQSFC